MTDTRMPFKFFFSFCHRFTGVVFVLFFLISPAVAISQKELPDVIISLWSQYANANNDSSKVFRLSRLAFLYQDYLVNSKAADSIASKAIQIALAGGSPRLIMATCNDYIESTDSRIYSSKSLDFADRAFRISIENQNLFWKWRTMKNISKIWLSLDDLNRALIYAKAVLAISRSLENDTLLAKSYLLVGECCESGNQKVEAFRHYLRALNIAEISGNVRVIMNCYDHLSSFYSSTRLLDDAIECKMKEALIIQGIKPVDSTALMWTQYNLNGFKVLQHRTDLNEQNLLDVILFAMRHRNERLKTWAFALYRRYLIETNAISALFQLYYVKFPGELKKLYSTDREMYYRLQGYFMELSGQKVSADFHFQKAEQLLMEDATKDLIYKAHFFNRYGQFLNRQGQKERAIVKFTRAFNLAGQDDNFARLEFMLVSSKNLEQLYIESLDFKKAWFYAAATNTITMEIQVISNNAQVKAELLMRERKQYEINTEHDREKIRYGKTLRNLMTAGLLFFIILTYLIYRNYTSQKRLNKLLDAEKRKSEDLLLNILPQETANELKETGKARAKKFAEVTVMFTDFKDFTQASEKMNAEELVHKINFYFCEFDRIISKHNIEKIKIIGDSYMCAGGLPVPNDTHACDVVKAALELQAFVIAQKVRHAQTDEPCFEVRIGIHSGPVVAGIVGLNKFAYDIWGDTVNTASRMESSGEIDRVNISGTTYDMVKDHFRCTYRGRVLAKNKGEIEMYIVEEAI